MLGARATGRSRGGDQVSHNEYCLRSQTTFECAAGKHYWPMSHEFIGVGERRSEGSLVQYQALV